MAHEFHHKRRIEFAETDMAGIVHFSNYIRYMEMAEHEFLRSLGLSVYTEITGRAISWPRVRAECSYRAPLAFEEILEVHLLVRKKTKRTITYDFHFHKEDGTPVAEGSVTVICVSVDTATQQMTSTEIPPAIDEKIDVAPAGLSESPPK